MHVEESVASPVNRTSGLRGPRGPRADGGGTVGTLFNPLQRGGVRCRVVEVEAPGGSRIGGGRVALDRAVRRAESDIAVLVQEEWHVACGLAGEDGVHEEDGRVGGGRMAHDVARGEARHLVVLEEAVGEERVAQVGVAAGVDRRAE